MEFTVMRPIKVNVSTIKVQARVRYPEDTNVYDGMVWIEDDNENPIMPCMVSTDDRCGKTHAWCPEIDVKTGMIRNWTKGFKADVSYKVCDEFQCELLDNDGNKVLKYEGYVPKFMDIDEDGWGDYIYLTIDENGHIRDWKFDHNHMDELNTYGTY